MYFSLFLLLVTMVAAYREEWEALVAAYREEWEAHKV